MSILKLIEWIELAPNRARRFVLISTIIMYLLVTVACMILVGFGKDMSSFSAFYYAVSAVAGSAIGFYTGEKITAIKNGNQAVESKLNF